MDILLWIWCWGAVALFLGQVLGNAAVAGSRASLPRAALQSLCWPVAALWLIGTALRDRWKR